MDEQCRATTMLEFVIWILDTAWRLWKGMVERMKPAMPDTNVGLKRGALAATSAL
jgi:hypothetical protein